MAYPILLFLAVLTRTTFFPSPSSLSLARPPIYSFHFPPLRSDLISSLFFVFFAGLHRSEITAGEIADELDKERKYLQLTTAEYLVRMNEIRTKKGVNLLQQMLEYYKSQLK